MPPRDALREALDRLSEIRRNPRTPEALQELKAALASKSNLVAARAASIAGQADLYDLVPQLCAAFDRFMVDPVNTDKTCQAKIAIVVALARLGAADEVLVKAARHVQMEPAFGGPIDTAAELRAIAIVALAERNHPASLEIASELLADKEPRARMGALNSFETLPSAGAAALLRYKALRYFKPHEPEDALEIAEILRTLLVCEPGDLRLVEQLMLDDDPDMAALAALAIGEARPRGAFEALARAYDARLEGEFRAGVIAAMAMLREDQAQDFLLGVVQGSNEILARAAFEALLPFTADAALLRRLGAAVKAGGYRDLAQALAGRA